MKTLTLSKFAKIIASVALPAMLLMPGMAAAQFGVSNVCDYAGFLAGCGSNGTKLAPSSGGGYIETFVDTIIFIAAIVSVFFVMVAGFKYITAGGDPGRTASAKNTLQYAIVGLILAILARAIVGFVVIKV